METPRILARASSPGVPSRPAPLRDEIPLPVDSVEVGTPREPRAPFLFADRYTGAQLLADRRAAARFVDEYLDWEANYFEVARHPESGLTYDGVGLDAARGQVAGVRDWSAPSKECLDLGILVKALEGDPRAARVVGRGDVDRARATATEILRRKLDSFEEFHRQNPGYGGFLPWFRSGASLSPTEDWKGQIPGLDNGEFVWTMMLAEKALRDNGQEDLAERYGAYNGMLRDNVSRVFYDAEAGKVRGDVRVTDPSSPSTRYETMRQPGRADFLTGEHGVHEGAMLVHYVTLFGDLSESQSRQVWDGIRMNRVEHRHGTTWEAYWGSAHESWAYLFLPLRDHPAYADLFRIREEIRTQNAADRGYPGLATSTNQPGGTGYLDGAGIEGVGSQAIRNNHTFAVYGAFPLLLEFARTGQGNHGVEWLHNMLTAPRMQGPLGGGESGTNDGRAVSPMKTIDGSFPNVLALCGGLEREMADLMQEKGVYDRFMTRLHLEYREAFGTAPLREPSGFASPPGPVSREHVPDYQSWNLAPDRR